MREDRRRIMMRTIATLGLVAGHGAARASVAYPPVRAGVELAFPRDHGAHPDYRIEWWYITGWLRRLDAPQGEDAAGVQITFFRTRTRHSAGDPSRFAPKQLLFAHAALALPGHAGLRVAQRAAREGLGLAHASTADTDVAIGSWRLARDSRDEYRARIDDAKFALDLSFMPHANPLLQGDAGFSRKGPLPSQASYYYSRPQLEVHGSIIADSRESPVEGIAWLDQEWSSELLDPHAAGWDWVGLNFDDGSALMAFRIRQRDGATLWTQARWCRPQQHEWRRLRDGDPTVHFEPLRHWTSPRTGARYPVSMQLDVGGRQLRLEPLIDAQELDTRGTSEVVYWEGAVRVYEAGGARVGRGYLELTGYAAPLRLR